MAFTSTASKIPDLPVRGDRRQTIPIAEEFQDLPPPYEPSTSASGGASTVPANQAPTSAARTLSTSSSTRFRSTNQAGGYERGPSFEYSAEARNQQTGEGYKPSEPMSFDEDKWEKMKDTPGCCFSDSGGCCCSSTGGCCFSERGGCCFSDTEACCFSSNKACCCSGRRK